jgi:hypothetical protein
MINHFEVQLAHTEKSRICTIRADRQSKKAKNAKKESQKRQKRKPKKKAKNAKKESERFVFFWCACELVRVSWCV